MQLRRVFPVVGFAALAVAIACSDSSSTAPTAGPLANVAASGQSDTGKTPPGNPTGPTTPPDTGSPIRGSNDPRLLGGTVVGMGPAGDTANYQKIAGATVVLSIPGDTASGTPDKELARTTSAADGSFSFGTFKIGVYAVTVTPPAGSPFKSAHWAFLIDTYSPEKINLSVWLGRK